MSIAEILNLVMALIAVATKFVPSNVGQQVNLAAHLTDEHKQAIADLHQAVNG